MRRLLLALLSLACVAAASDPSERLPDPAQEARARALFEEIRCVVCQNESIDDSEADLAADMRRVVRAQVAAGRSDAEVRAYLVDRYGEFVLLKPPFSAANLALWLTPALLLAVGGGWLLWRAGRTLAQMAPEPLSEAEEAQLAALTQTEKDGHAFAPTSPREDAQDDRRVS